MVSVTVKSHRKTSKTKTPKKATKTPVKSLQKQAKPPVMSVSKTLQNAQASPKKATRNRGHKNQEENIEKQEQKYEEVIVSKKAKQTPNCRKSVPPAAVEVQSDADEDTEDEETDLNLFQANDESEDDENEDEIEDGDEKSSDEKEHYEKAYSDDEEHDDDDDDEGSNDEEGDCNKNNEVSALKQTEKEENKVFEIPQVLVKNISNDASSSSIKEHFQDCGEILKCFITKNTRDKKTICIIKYKELSEAKCAVAIKNQTQFEGRTINVEICLSRHVFTTEDTVILINSPLVSRQKVRAIKLEMSKLFGNVCDVRWHRRSSTTFVKFEKKSSVVKALKATRFNFMGTNIKIQPYDPNSCNKVILFGVTSELKEEDIQIAMSVHCTVISTTIPTDQVTGNRKTYAILYMQSIKDVDKLLALETIKIKNVILDILPNNLSTIQMKRHPACIFVEKLSKNISEANLWKFFSRFGNIDDIDIIYNGHVARIQYETKASADKVLKFDAYEINNISFKVHAVDGVYKPCFSAYNVHTTVYISKIPERKYVTEIITNIKVMVVQNFRMYEVIDRLTKEFKNAIILEFANKRLAQQALDAKIKLSNKAVVLPEKYDPAKHEFVTDENNVLIGNLNENTSEVDLWKSFQKYGEITNTVVLRNCNKASVGWGYVQFATADIAQKALKASTIDINRYQAKVIKPTREILDLIDKSNSQKSKF